jgi:NAD(P)-dependent dehydrogenase (short-subunit alcohol dehydrogenase family)
VSDADGAAFSRAAKSIFEFRRDAHAFSFFCVCAQTILNRVQRFVGLVYREVRLHGPPGAAAGDRDSVEPHGSITGTLPQSLIPGVHFHSQCPSGASSSPTRFSCQVIGLEMADNLPMFNIVITGASRGIGLVTAVELARAGHQVVATMRNPAGSPELGEQAAREKLPIRIETMDVDSDESVKQAFDRILALAPVDVLVNNAGVERTGSIEEAPLFAFRACMETNYFGALRCIQAVIPPMRERASGVIINVTSVAGQISVSPLGPYSASKFALEALSEALAQELRAFGVRVAIVEPGIIDTRMARNIEQMGESKVYPQVRRIAALFAGTSAAGAGQPQVVGQKVREIIESGTWQLRHPVGPDAEAFLSWRHSMNDEQWVQWSAQSDSDWLKSVKTDFGMDIKLD